MVSLEELLVIIFGLLLRAMTSVHPHSGQGVPPMFGDYEAQRHWQEITVNLPIQAEYIHKDCKLFAPVVCFAILV